MLACLLICRLALQQLTDQVDTAAWSIGFIAQQLVGRTGGITETAMNALSNDLLGFFCPRLVLQFLMQVDFHDSEIRVQATGVQYVGGIQ